MAQMPGGTPPNSTKAPDDKPRQPLLSTRLWWMLMAGVLIFNIIFYYADLRINSSTKPAQVKLPYSAFVAEIRANNVSTARIEGSTITGDFKQPYKEPKET